jgi:hypothetical protein
MLYPMVLQTHMVSTNYLRGYFYKLYECTIWCTSSGAHWTQQCNSHTMQGTLLFGVLSDEAPDTPDVTAKPPTHLFRLLCELNFL